MRTLLTLLFFLFAALSCVTCAADLIQVFEYEGRDAHISCSYDQGYENDKKYLCKDNCTGSDFLITTSQTNTTKYSIYDDKAARIFTTTISSLRSMDAGKYWCGVSRTGKDIYTEVNLQIKPEWCCVKTNNLRGIEGHLVTLSCPYPPQHRNNRKFLCKGAHQNNCTDVVTSGSRFTLQENVSSSSFSVMITKLEEGDAGTFWCGSDLQWSVGNYTKIELSVDVTQLKMLVYIVPALLLTLSFALIIIYKCKAKEPVGNNLEAVNSQKTTGAHIYRNHDAIVMRSQQSAGSDFEDANYETSSEEIYCNEPFHKTHNVKH